MRKLIFTILLLAIPVVAQQPETFTCRVTSVIQPVSHEAFAIEGITALITVECATRNRIQPECAGSNEANCVKTIFDIPDTAWPKEWPRQWEYGTEFRGTWEGSKFKALPPKESK
jgi:hypothetical protein